MSSGSRYTLRSVMRSALGPAARRVRREVQWRSGPDFGVARGDSARCPYLAASHSTPLIRRLAGLDMQLQINKIRNLELAAERLDGILLLPGQRLSFWHEVGKPTRRRGFLDGLVLSHGRLSAGVGGGLCQMTNLLFWMTLHTPLTVTERWRHSYDVFPDAGRTQPFGSGATCAWPTLDLQVQNDTSDTFMLSVSVADSHLTGAWLCSAPPESRYEVEERMHVITHDGPGRYTRRNELWRTEYDRNGVRVGESLVACNAALMMYQPFLPEPSRARSA